MLVESFIISVIIALGRKGKITNLGLIQLRGISLLFVALFIQMIVDFLGKNKLAQIGFSIHVISYLILFYFFWINKKNLNLFLPIGTGLNFLVIICNNGSMPVKTTYMPVKVIEKLNNSVTHSIMDINTKLSWLADIFYVKWPTDQMLSLGDIFLDIGIFILIQKTMVHNRKSIKNY